MGSTELGKRIQIIRKKRHLTQLELAQKLGVSRSAVGMWEYGSNEPNLDMIKKLADALDVEYELLLVPEEEMRKLVTPKLLAETGGDLYEAFCWGLLMGDITWEPKLKAAASDAEILEALHQNPRLGLLFKRSSKMTTEDVDFMILMADKILKERDGD